MSFLPRQHLCHECGKLHPTLCPDRHAPANMPELLAARTRIATLEAELARLTYRLAEAEALVAHLQRIDKERALDCMNLTAELARVHGETIEECARAIEPAADAPSDTFPWSIRRQLAAHVRALASQPTPACKPWCQRVYPRIASMLTPEDVVYWQGSTGYCSHECRTAGRPLHGPTCPTCKSAILPDGTCVNCRRPAETGEPTM